MAIAVLLLILGTILGVYVHYRNETKDSNINMREKLALIGQQEQIKSETNLKTTSAIEEKLSPNCIVIEKQYFKGCDHLLREEREAPIEWTNFSKEEIQNQYPGWVIEKFTNDEIVVYQEQEGFCGQHYIIRENNGILSVYTIDENGNEEWKEDTGIQTMYLPETDLEKIKNGIEALGDAELRTILGDYE